MRPLPPEVIAQRQRTQEAAHRAFVRLEEIAREYAHDPEEAHQRADGVLCGLLTQLGCKDVADKYESITRWYA